MQEPVAVTHGKFDEQRFLEMAAARRAGMTDQQVADIFASKYGRISRERVRQILKTVPRAPRPKKPDPRENWVHHHCDICGSEMTTYDKPGVPCKKNIQLHLCTAHQVLRSQVWRLIDDDYFRNHRRLVTGKIQPTYSSPTWSTRERRRWLNRGSRLHKALLEAYRNEMPIIARFPEEIQEQLRVDSGIFSHAHGEV